METPHNSLPTFENLSKRGIQVTNRCLMCDEEEETTIHQFLNCPCARSIRHGSILGLRTSELQCNSIEQWLSQCIISSRALEYNRMNYLLALFTTLWSIWNHRNMVACWSYSHFSISYLQVLGSFQPKPSAGNQIKSKANQKHPSSKLANPYQSGSRQKQKGWDIWFFFWSHYSGGEYSFQRWSQ